MTTSLFLILISQKHLVYKDLVLVKQTCSTKRVQLEDGNNNLLNIIESGYIKYDSESG